MSILKNTTSKKVTIRLTGLLSVTIAPGESKSVNLTRLSFVPSGVVNANAIEAVKAPEVKAEKVVKATEVKAEKVVKAPEVKVEKAPEAKVVEEPVKVSEDKETKKRTRKTK